MPDDIESFELGQPVHIHVLVTGATGHQGRSLARLLLGRGHHVRGVTRDRELEASRALEDQGAEMVVADFEQPETIERAATGMDAAYLTCTPYEQGADAERRWAIGAADAIQRAGVDHLVYSSVANADRNTGIPHFESRKRVEDHVRGLGMSHTILAPAFFMENLLGPQVLPDLAQGKLRMPLPPDRELQMVPVANLAQLSLLALERREGLTGARVDVASDELSGYEMAEILEGVLEREIEYEEIPRDEAYRTLGDDRGKMYEWLREEGYSVDIDRLRSEQSDVGWLGFSEWARAQDWDGILQRITA